MTFRQYLGSAENALSKQVIDFIIQLFQAERSSIDLQEETFDDLTVFEVTKDEDEDLDDISHAGSRSDRSRNSESSFLDMKSPNFDDFGNQ